MILSKWQYSGKNRFVSKINHLDGGSSNNAGYATCVIEELVFESSCHLAPSLVTVCSHFSAPVMGWHLEAYSEAWSVDTRRLTTSLGLVGNCYRLLSIWLKIMRISFLFGVFFPTIVEDKSWKSKDWSTGIFLLRHMTSRSQVIVTRCL